MERSNLGTAISRPLKLAMARCWELGIKIELIEDNRFNEGTNSNDAGVARPGVNGWFGNFVNHCDVVRD